MAEGPSGYNTFVQDHEASGRMKVDFTRNIVDFAFNRWCQILKVPKSAGYYLNITVEEAGRIINSDLSDFVWPDSAPRKEGNDGTESFAWLPFRTTRYDYAALLGDKAVDQASWDISETTSRQKGQQAMTARTTLGVTALTASGSYDATHKSDVDAITESGITNSGNFAQSTVARQDIRRTYLHALRTIKQDTLASVKASQMNMVMGPDTAIGMSQTQEIVDYVKGSPAAWGQLHGDLPNQNKEYGLPEVLHGIETIVEDSYATTTRKGITTVKSQVFPASTAVMASRVGDLESPGGGPSFSTCMLFTYEDMTAETLRDARNRRTETHYVDDVAAVLTAPVSGFLLTSTVS